jgi:hypothetical protein
MLHGVRGIYGKYDNLVSVTYRWQKSEGRTNPPLSAFCCSLNELNGNLDQFVTKV